MTNFKGNYVTRDDVKVAKNYLTELELQRLNILTSQFLDYAEFQALEQTAMRMADWIAVLDDTRFCGSVRTYLRATAVYCTKKP